MENDSILFSHDIAVRRLSQAAFLNWISSDALDDFFSEIHATLYGKKHQKKKAKLDIPLFYHPPKKNTFQNLSNIKPDSILNFYQFGSDILSKLELSPYFAIQIIRTIQPTGKTITFQQFKDYYISRLQGQSLNKQAFIILLGDACNKRNFLLPCDFYNFIENYIQIEAPKILDQSLKNLFIQFISQRIYQIYDPEMRGKISENSFFRFPLLQVFEKCSRKRDFNIIVERYTEVLHKAPVNEGISIKTFGRMEHHRLNPFLVQRVLQFLPSNCSNGVNILNFGFYLMVLEDKTSPIALNFWFKVCDLDEDGILSFSEMNKIFHYQKAVLQKELGQKEKIKFKTLIPQICDLIGIRGEQISKSVLQKCNRWSVLFNVLVDAKLFLLLDFSEENLCSQNQNLSPWEEYCRAFRQSHNNRQ